MNAGIALLWILFAFFCGSIPLSYWLGLAVLKVDIRQYGDGNPGGTNVWKAGGWRWGMLAILLDAFKGLVPVALADYAAHLIGWLLVAVCLAPLLGHAYTPFLNFQGGKSLATTFGVWTALTLYEAPLVLGISMGLGIWLLHNEGWAVLFGSLVLLVYLLIWNPTPVFLAVWAGSSALLIWRYRDMLRNAPPRFGQNTKDS